MEDCAVCVELAAPRHLRDLMVVEDDLFAAAHLPVPERQASTHVGHLLVVPQRHICSPSALTDPEAERLGYLIARLSGMLEAGLGAEHVYVLRLGDGWEHLHVHLVARHPGTPERYRGLDVEHWPDAPRADRARLVEVAGSMRRLTIRHMRSRPVGDHRSDPGPDGADPPREPRAPTDTTAPTRGHDPTDEETT